MSSTVENKADLKTWLERVKNAKSRKEVFALLDDFRKENFHDDERAQMAHLYMRMLEVLGEDTDDDTQSAAAPKAAADENQKPDDGPVWYEKM